MKTDRCITLARTSVVKNKSHQLAIPRPDGGDPKSWRFRGFQLLTVGDDVVVASLYERREAPPAPVAETETAGGAS